MSSSGSPPPQDGDRQPPPPPSPGGDDPTRRLEPTEAAGAAGGAAGADDATVPMDTGAPTGPSPLRGTVNDADSGAPIDAAQVEVVARDGQLVGRASTVADGRFTVAGVEPGSYQIVVNATGRLTERHEHTHPGGRVQIHLHVARCTGSVRPVDAAPGDEVHATVTLFDAEGRELVRTMTDSTGRFALEVAGHGPHRLEVTAAGYFTARRTLGAEELATPLTVDLHPAELQGQVIAEEGEEPVLDAQVRLRDLDGNLVGQAATDPGGRFLIPLAQLPAPAATAVGPIAQHGQDSTAARAAEPGHGRQHGAEAPATHRLAVAADGFEAAEVELTLTDEVPEDHVIVLAPTKRSPWVWVGVGAAVLALLAVLLWWFGGPTTTVPDLVGASVEDATEQLEAAELELGAVDTEESDAEPGTVLAQSEEPDSEVSTGTEVDLTAAAPPGEVVVPNVVGLRRGPAERALEDAGLELGIVRFSPSAETPAGRVLSSDPVTGVVVAPGDEIDLVLAVEEDEDAAVEVPQVVGRQESDALRLLDAGGFEVLISRVPADESAGIVVDQDPGARTEVAPGATVSIEISEGPEAPEPDPEPEPEPDPEPDPEPEPDPDPDPEPEPDPENGEGPGLPELPEVPEFDTEDLEGFFERVVEWFRNLFN